MGTPLRSWGSAFPGGVLQDLSGFVRMFTDRVMITAGGQPPVMADEVRIQSNVPIVRGSALGSLTRRSLAPKGGAFQVVGAAPAAMAFTTARVFGLLHEALGDAPMVIDARGLVVSSPFGPASVRITRGDVAFITDTTGSMGGTLSAVRQVLDAKGRCVQ